MTETSTPDLAGPLEAAAVNPRCTLLQYIRARRIRLSPRELSVAGQVLAARCRAEGIELPKVKERGGWRQTNLYPRSLLESWEEHRPAWEDEWDQTRAARRGTKAGNEAGMPG
jgi:hypothetical protein